MKKRFLEVQKGVKVREVCTQANFRLTEGLRELFNQINILEGEKK